VSGQKASVVPAFTGLSLSLSLSEATAEELAEMEQAKVAQQLQAVEEEKPERPKAALRSRAGSSPEVPKPEEGTRIALVVGLMVAGILGLGVLAYVAACLLAFAMAFLTGY
jgi:hypothetical protein